MGKLRFEISMSLDGYVAGPNQSLDDPLGKGGEELHEWIFPLAAWRREHGQEGGEITASSPLLEQRVANLGAYIMGRNMFGGGPGGWGDGSWEGWWGDDPPYHVPVFVLTHHPREPLPMAGGTTFHFVTDGIESALARAREAAGERDVLLAGGADVANQYLRANLLDELQINLTPVLLGSGERLFDGLAGASPKLEQTRVVEGVGVTHLFYRRQDG
ncbi:MAG TPA: dihydrofolate reductase family protein [Conexibacter sp.]|nr:dihydrofolate reductase family protein [Conexibacter sp.]